LVTIKPTEHVFIAGRNGSGKTFLARKYLTGFENVVCLDTKGTTVWPEIDKKELVMVDSLSKLEKVKAPKIIYRPRFEELEPEYYEAFFKWIYFRKNCIVWIDEVMSICPNPFRIPEYYKAILTRGRERDTAAWSLSQRPSGIPAVTMSEAIHFFVFDLNMPQDRNKMAEISGCTQFLDPPGKYNFWYYQVNEESAVKARLKVEGGKK